MGLIGANQNSAYGDYLRSHGKRGFDWRFPAVALGGPLLGAAAPALFGGGAAATTAGTTAATGAKGMTLGNLLKLGELGVGATTSLLGARSANNTARYAANQNAQTINAQMALERDRLAAEDARVARQEAEAKRQWDAQQVMAQRQFDASEEERLYNRRLLDEREARASGRRAMADRARRRLGVLLGIG